MTARKRAAKAPQAVVRRPGEPARWAVVYRAPRGRRLAWLVIDSVPVPSTRRAVLDALSAWRYWQRYTNVPAGVTLSVLPEARWGELRGLDKAPRVRWDELAPEGRQIAVRVPGEVWRQCRVAAMRDGLPLFEWAATRLAAAAERELADAGVTT